MATQTEPCLYWKSKADEISLSLVYVDDVIEATNSKLKHEALFKKINAE